MESVGVTSRSVGYDRDWRGWLPVWIAAGAPVCLSGPRVWKDRIYRWAEDRTLILCVYSSTFVGGCSISKRGCSLSHTGGDRLDCRGILCRPESVDTARSAVLRGWLPPSSAKGLVHALRRLDYASPRVAWLALVLCLPTSCNHC